MVFYPYYQQEIEKLEMYQRLIQYWSMIFDRREKIHVLDNMNFNLSVFPEVITWAELNSLQSIEPGYMSPDAYTELHPLIRALEYERLVRHHPTRVKTAKGIVQAAGVGCGNGCTNVMNGVLNSIIKFSREQFNQKGNMPEIILVLPNYTVYSAQLSNLNYCVKTKYIYAGRRNCFLATSEEIKQRITKTPWPLCSLTLIIRPRRLMKEMALTN
jgi:hypothetical protein